MHIVYLLNKLIKCRLLPKLIDTLIILLILLHTLAYIPNCINLWHLYSIHCNALVTGKLVWVLFVSKWSCFEWLNRFNSLQIRQYLNSTNLPHLPRVTDVNKEYVAHTRLGAGDPEVLVSFDNLARHNHLVLHGYLHVNCATTRHDVPAQRGGIPANIHFAHLKPES